MQQADFWEIIENAKAASNGDGDLQAELVLKKLMELTPEEIVGFEECFGRVYAPSYRNDLWAATYIINGGCSDDGFDYFRGWLIAQGRSVYEEALQDPATLIDHIVMDGDWEAWNEDILYVARTAYEKVTGNEMPRVEYPFMDLEGDEWDEDSVEELYPDLAKKAYSRWD